MRVFTTANSYIKGYTDGVNHGIIVAFQFVQEYCKHRNAELNLTGNPDTDSKTELAESRGYDLIIKRLDEELLEVCSNGFKD